MEIIHNLKGWFIETEIDNICYVINEPGNSFKKPSMTCSFWFGRLFFGVKRGGGVRGTTDIHLLTRSGSGREWYRAFPDWGPLAEDSAAKLKRSQLNVSTLYV